MADLIQASDFAELFRNNTPLLDVRAPVEFARGAYPAATNIPLLTDSEREAVGRCYREQGRDAAIDLGHTLVASDERERRLNSWLAYVTANPGAALYCYRGGLRSSIVQQWLADAGAAIPKVDGGYKALRRFLIKTLEKLADNDNIVIVAGKTGSGKTHFINSLSNSLDLEGRAQHRGSAFGRHPLPQPSQSDFENQLGIDTLSLVWDQHRRVIIEDESRAIGSLSVPQMLHKRMTESPIAVIEETMEQRVSTIHLDYIQSNYAEFHTAFPDNADALFAESLSSSLLKIKRRLGDEAYLLINGLLQQALEKQFSGQGIDDHRLWIAELLTRYYDPMYEYQLGRKSDRIVFRGSRDELANWIKPMTEAN